MNCEHNLNTREKEKKKLTKGHSEEMIKKGNKFPAATQQDVVPRGEHREEKRDKDIGTLFICQPPTLTVNPKLIHSSRPEGDWELSFFLLLLPGCPCSKQDKECKLMYESCVPWPSPFLPLQLLLDDCKRRRMNYIQGC